MSGDGYKVALLDLQFLPSIEYILFITTNDIMLDQHEHYVKQTFRNRCHILTSNKVLDLVVPVKKGSQKRPVNSVEIDYTHHQLKPIWRSIQSAYSRSPFFEHYADELKEIILGQEKYLFTLNLKLLSYCLRCINYDKPLKLSDSYLDADNVHFRDFRSVFHPRKDYSSNGIYHPSPYTQIFGSKFVPNLSIIDLLFCEGPNANQIIRDSRQKPTKQSI